MNLLRNPGNRPSTARDKRRPINIGGLFFFIQPLTSANEVNTRGTAGKRSHWFRTYRAAAGIDSYPAIELANFVGSFENRE
jgi:hypothetical protein